MPISVIIPTYKEPEYLDLCLKSIFKTQTLDNEIIVVVDGFMDLNKPVLDKYPKVKILDLVTNRGLSVGTNWGVYNSSNPEILVVNDDNVFCDGWDMVLNNASFQNQIISINQIEPNPSMFNQFIIKDLGKTPQEFNLDKFLEYSNKLDKKYLDNTGSTLPFFMRKEDFLKIGGWDIMYPSPHIVDWDFFLKCSLSKFSFIRTYDIHFYHFAGAATRKTLEQSQESTRKELLAHEFAHGKWGSYIKHNPKDNSKYL